MAGDVVSQVMNFGAPTPIEVAVSGPNMAANRVFAEKVLAEIKSVPSLRDLQFGQPLDYPTVDIKIDRERAGQLGVTVEQIGRSLVAATSSSRFTQPNYWRDPASGVAYQVQVDNLPLTTPLRGGGQGRLAAIAWPDGSFQEIHVDYDGATQAVIVDPEASDAAPVPED